MFYNGSCKMSQENKMRICKYVHLSRQSIELGRGWHFWSEDGIFSFILCHFICYLIAQHSENWKKEKQKQTKTPAADSSFLWKVTAEVGGTEFLSLDNKTTNSGINNYKKTVSGQVLTILYSTLFYLLKELAKML